MKISKKENNIEVNKYIFSMKKEMKFTFNGFENDKKFFI